MIAQAVNCDWCTTSFTKKNKTHRFCSTSCRKKWHKEENGDPLLPSFITQKQNKPRRRSFVGNKRTGTSVSVKSFNTPEMAQIQSKINWLESQMVGTSITQKIITSAGAFGLAAIMTENPLIRVGAAVLPFLFGKSKREIELQNGNIQFQINELESELIGLSQVPGISTPTVPSMETYEDFKVIAATDLDGLENEKYLLDEKWRYFLNYLPHSFNAIIHGLPKAGKTHLSIQFAQYLQKKFGKVLYVSGEEGVEEPFNDKLKKWNATFKVAYDVKGSFGIMKAIEQTKPKFVFIDSLNRLGLNVTDIITLKETFPKTVFIYIMQSTKAGNFKGGQDIAHEVTSMIKVVDGQAIQKGRTVPEPTQLAVFN